MPQELKIFDNIPIRTFWNEGEEKWYFCIIDIIKALTDSKNPSDYLKKL